MYLLNCVCLYQSNMVPLIFSNQVLNYTTNMMQVLIFITELDNFGSLRLRLLVENTECCVLLGYLCILDCSQRTLKYFCNNNLQHLV